MENISDLPEETELFEFLSGALSFDLPEGWVYDQASSEAYTNDEENDLYSIYYISNLLVDPNLETSQTLANLEITYNPYQGLTYPGFVELTVSSRFPTATNRMDDEYETHDLFGDIPAQSGLIIGKWYTSHTTDGEKRFVIEMVLEGENNGFIIFDFGSDDGAYEFTQEFCESVADSIILRPSVITGEMPSADDNPEYDEDQDYLLDEDNDLEDLDLEDTSSE